MNRNSQGNLIGFNTSSLLNQSRPVAPPSTQEMRAPDKTAPRPFAAAANVKAYLASLQAKVRQDEPAETDTDETSSLSTSSADTKIELPVQTFPAVAGKQQHPVGLNRTDSRARHQPAAPSVEEESSGSSLSSSSRSIFNVKSISQLSDIEEHVVTKPEPIPKPSKTNMPNKETLEQSSASEIIRSFGSLDVPTEIQIHDLKAENARQQSTFSGHESEMHSPGNTSDDIDTVLSQNGVKLEETDEIENEYESDFEPADDEKVEEAGILSSAENSESQLQISESSSANELTSGPLNKKASKKIKVAKGRGRKEKAVQYQSRNEKCIQTEPFPPVTVSVAEFFHSDYLSRMPYHPTMAAHIALANYRNAVDPGFMHNRLIASVLEAHLHCIRAFAEGQRAIYEQWNEILDAKKGQRRLEHRHH